MNILNICPKVLAIILVLILSGCENQKILTTLAVDRSASNVNNVENRKNVIDICKFFVSKMKDTDTLVLKEFDSQPRPSKLDDFLDKPNAKKRNQFKENRCPTILPDQPAANAVPGTDIRSVWIEYYKNYDKRKTGGNNENSIKTTEIAVFYVDSLEPVSQNYAEIKSLDNFEKSVQQFIKDKNFIIIFIANKEYREILGRELDSITDLEKRLILSSPSDYKQTIEETYNKMRSGNFN